MTTNTNDMTNGQNTHDDACENCGSTDAVLDRYEVHSPTYHFRSGPSLSPPGTLYLYIECGDCGHRRDETAHPGDIQSELSKYRLRDGSPAADSVGVFVGGGSATAADIDKEIDEMEVDAEELVKELEEDTTDETETESGDGTVCPPPKPDEIDEVPVDADELVREIEETFTVGPTSDGDETTDDHDGPLAPGETVTVEHPSNPLTIWRPGDERAYRAEPADDPVTDTKPFDISESSVAYHLKEYDYERVDDEDESDVSPRDTIPVETGDDDDDEGGDGDDADDESVWFYVDDSGVKVASDPDRDPDEMVIDSFESGQRPDGDEFAPTDQPHRISLGGPYENGARRWWLPHREDAEYTYIAEESEESELIHFEAEHTTTTKPATTEDDDD